MTSFDYVIWKNVVEKDPCLKFGSLDMNFGITNAIIYVLQSFNQGALLTTLHFT